MHLKEPFHLRSWPPSRNGCQQINSTVFCFPIFCFVRPILRKASVNPRTHDLRSLRFIPTANQRLQNVGCSLAAGCKVGTWGWHREIETDELEGVIFELFDIMFSKRHIRDNDTLNKGGNSFTSREQSLVVTRSNGSRDEAQWLWHQLK